MSQTLIAQAVKCSQTAVSQTLAAFNDSTDLASLRLRGYALEAVEDWCQASRVARSDGNHKPAKDLLIAAGVVQPDQQGAQVAIVMGDGAVAVGPAPTFASETQ
jgi:hypothetical protein